MFKLLLLSLLIISSSLVAANNSIKKKDFSVERFINDVYTHYSSDGVVISHENMEKMMHDLGLMEEEHDEHEHGHDEHGDEEEHADEHTDEHGHEEEHEKFEPVELQSLYDEYLIVASEGVNKEKFQALSVPLLSQHLSKINFVPPAGSEKSVSAGEAWGYGFLATFLVCLTSLIGVFFLSVLDRPAVMSTMIGLGVGVLFGDAVLHLIPYALGVHSHEESVEEVEDHYKTLKIGLVILAGVYFMFIMESFFEHFGHSHSHSHGHGPAPPISEKTDSSAAMMVVVDDVDKEGNKTPSGSWKDIKFVGWMVTIGDGIHNFVDGLSIGASFTVSLSLGWTTTIAVILHEAPHEIADFAIMLKSGFTFWKAAGVNLLSSLSAFLGLIIGVATGLNSEEAQAWILALTAGIFIYISLVSLLPEIRMDKKQSKATFIWANVGMLVGFLIMILIVIFEEEVSL